jgi:hypothetical protein
MGVGKMSARNPTIKPHDTTHDREPHSNDDDLTGDTTVIKSTDTNVDELDENIPPPPFCNLPVENPVQDLPVLGRDVFPPDVDTDLYVDEPNFEEWNEKQEPIKRIYYPREFSLEPPKIKFDEAKKDTAPKNDGSGGTAEFKKIMIKEPRPGGKDRSVVVSTPAMIAPSGYKETNTGTDFVKSIKAILDMDNPHHRYWWYRVMDPIVTACADATLSAPGLFDLKCQKYATEADRRHKNYPAHLADAKKQFCDIIRIPKTAEEFDLTSPKRIFYLNPMNIPAAEATENTKARPANEMAVFIGGQKKTMEELEHLCMGYTSVKDPVTGESKIELKNPCGFEFSAELLITRVFRASKTSLQIKVKNIYIHRFFRIPRGESAAMIKAKSIAEKIHSDFEQFDLKGFKPPEVVRVPPKPEPAPVSAMAGNRPKSPPKEEEVEIELTEHPTGPPPPKTPIETAVKPASKFGAFRQRTGPPA